MIENSYILGDNLDIIKTLPKEYFTLCYMDPPFYTNRNFGDFEDRWDSIGQYAGFLRKRFEVIYDILNNRGNLIVHVDPKASHYIRLHLDAIFGINNFQNEIIWKTSGNKKTIKCLSRSHDVLIVYSKNSINTFNPIYNEYDENYKKKNGVKICDITGREYITSAAYNNQPNVIKRINLRYSWNGHYKQWWISKEKMKDLHDNNRLIYNKKGVPRIKRYLDEMSGIPIRDVWTDISSIQIGEKTDYATQKPIALLKRIISMYSNHNDWVLDPFAGSGTTGRACIKLNRKCILIDKNKKGLKIFKELNEVGDK